MIFSTNQVYFVISLFYIIAFQYSAGITNSLSIERTVIRWSTGRKGRRIHEEVGYEREGERGSVARRTFCEIDTGRRWYRTDPTRVTYYRAAGMKSNLFCCYFQRTCGITGPQGNMGNRTFRRSVAEKEVKIFKYIPARCKSFR